MRPPQELLRRKREGAALGDDEIAALVAGIADGGLSDAQVGAFAMAVCVNGMNEVETAALTRAMTASGRRLDWRGFALDGPVVDKHSTGGVGDKVSLMLAPMLAAIGGYVPMISGRGLGHTGGTLDKLDSIPGYGSGPDLARFQRVVAEVGCAIIGQTDDLAPADRRLYAIRDVTGTVESIPLITASILSKKLAAGLEALVMDVKTGNAAFAVSLQMAHELAAGIAAAAAAARLPATALITDMNQVLGTTAGNALEVGEAVAYLRGEAREPRLHEVVLALGESLAVLAGLAENAAAAREGLLRALDSGTAAERFARMVAALGGPADLLETAERRLPQASVMRPVPAAAAGVVEAMDARALGLAVVRLGGGRRRPHDRIDPAVGLSHVLPLGTVVAKSDPLALVHAGDEAAAAQAVAEVAAAIRIGAASTAASPVILERLGPPDPGAPAGQGRGKAG